ncbi:MAG: phage replisome organizer N-terminal domain-containing protein [Clostridia bacterium]|nr:phage replisome organizer N-terminal domain-containing protein [Clostridia bacterium]
MSKRYYWLKLKDDFFAQKAIKKLRKIAGGDTYVIIYLKMQLKSIKNEGILKFEGVEEDFAEELALDLDEDIENVKITLSFLQSQGLIEQVSDNNYKMPEVANCIGSETDSAERKRNQRLRQKQELLNCDKVTLLSQASHVEKEIEKDIDIDNDRQIDNKLININNSDDFKNLKLVEEATQKYDEALKEKNIFIEREFINILPKKDYLKYALFQNAVSYLLEEESEYFNKIDELILFKVYDNYISTKKENEIANDLKYFVTALKNEVIKQKR